jgi:tetratricopeptide (TPR) repeat protein
VEKLRKHWGENDYYYFYLKGKIEETEGNLKEAAVSYRKALKINPGAGEASSSLSEVEAKLRSEKKKGK